MKNALEPIIFFGSGPVAAKSLELLAQHFVFEAIITKPRAAHHTGDVPVIAVAEQLGAPLLFASTKQELDDVFYDYKPRSKVAILIDFGIIVSQTIINRFALGIINSHFSILPEWRGADPITFAILSGQKQTGVSLMLLVPAMDEGPLIAYDTYDLPKTITAPELTTNLIYLSHKLLTKELPKYLAGSRGVTPQEEMTNRQVSYSRKLTKEDGILDWSKPADQLEREIRAFIEWPKSRFQLGDSSAIVTQSHVLDEQGHPGRRTIIDRQPAIYCREKTLVLDKIKPAGKKEMTGQAFLAGYKNIFLGAQAARS